MCRKILCFFLATVILMSFVGCNNNGGTQQPTSEPTTTPTATTTPPPPEEKFITETIIANRTTEYGIVYDEDDAMAAVFAENLANAINTKYNTQIKSKPLSVSEPLGEYEIVISGARKGVEDVEASLKDFNDFAIKLKEKNLILYAKGHQAYSYMLEYLKNEVFGGLKNGELTMTSDDDMVYSQSKLKNLTYPEYLEKKSSQSVDRSALQSMFEPRIYEYETDVTMPYRLYVPMTYDSAKKYPVLLLLHGAGERGTDNAAQLNLVFSQVFNQNDSPFNEAIIIAPQCPAGKQWVNTPWANGDYRVNNVAESDEITFALEIFDSVTEEFSCDDKRYYITGISMGGFGAWDILMRHPNMFAGAVPICGGADSTKGAVVKDIPIWTVHSIDDPTVPVSGTQLMVQAIKNAGGNKIKYTELNGYGHGVWNYTASSPEIYKWLFEQTK